MLLAAIVLLLVPASVDAATVTLSPPARVLTCTPEAVWATPATAVTYQWSLDGQPVAGAVGSTIALTKAGAYTCNLVGTALSTGLAARDTASLEVRDTFSPESYEQFLIAIYASASLAASADHACAKTILKAHRAKTCNRAFGRVASELTRVADAMRDGLPIVAGTCTSDEQIAEQSYRTIARSYAKLSRGGPVRLTLRPRKTRKAANPINAFARDCAPR